MSLTAGNPRNSRWRVLILALAVALMASSVLATGVDAKKKKGGSAKAFSQQKTVNAAIPDPANTNTPAAPLASTINVPKKFKGKLVGDVNVTGIKTTGSGPGAADDLTAYLTAPNGRVLQLFFAVSSPTNASLGPWTLDDDTPVSICGVPSPSVCTDPDQSLHSPFAGTSNLNFNWGGGTTGFFPENGILSIFNGTPMKGTWTFRIVDSFPAGGGSGTSTLNSWGLRITPLKPVSG